MMLDEFKSQLNFGLDFMKEKIKETGKIMWLPDTALSGLLMTKVLNGSLKIGHPAPSLPA
jgi:hypothetical protein